MSDKPDRPGHSRHSAMVISLRRQCMAPTLWQVEPKNKRVCLPNGGLVNSEHRGSIGQFAVLLRNTRGTVLFKKKQPLV